MRHTLFSIPAKICLPALVLTIAAFSQGPVGDTVMVNLDRPVHVGSSTLAPGDYTIREIGTASNARVLEFTSDKGTKMEATATAIPVVQNAPPGQTKLILKTEGGEARLSRIWVQGKTYGYEFPGEATGTATASAGLAMQGQYQPAIVAAAAPPPPAPAPEPAEATPPDPQPEAVAEQTPPPPAPQAEPAPAPEPPMPATSLGWADTLAAALVLTLSGALLYRRTVRS